MKGKLKVLVVDDDRRMVKTICDILTVKGYEPVPAYSGECAVEKAGSEEPDCVLMDLKMPGIDGVEALTMIRRASPMLPVILMSAYATDEKAEEAKRQGAYGILAKPVDIQQVLSFLTIISKEESILIVDDDPVFCRTLTAVLKARGYRVETETEAGKVLGRLEKEYKLLVVLDVKLGSADGVELLREIRAQYPTKPVVMVTGYQEGMSRSADNGLRIGAYACLYKPFEAEELVQVIEDVGKIKLRAVLGESF